MNYNKENPWIKEREATICTWKIDYNRGYINNMDTSLLIDFACMSNRQLAEYAKMLKSCGFTGVQVTDMATAWRAGGSWENVHDKYKVFADELHKIGMKFTLWVWAAKFTGHGWVDEDVVYQSSDPDTPPCKDERVLASFNKYYDIYADMAPYSDRVIVHFFDPGEIWDMESIVYFTKLLASKFRAINPAIKVGIDTWGSPDEYPTELVKAGMDDIMLMELPFLPTWKEEGKRAKFREGVKSLGVELGSWGWYTCDYEIDQTAAMTVNNRVISHVFNETRRQADHVMIPSYWSELESYHILNFFSMYAAGHLMINPDADPDVLLRESACLMTGSASGEDTDKLMTVLELIRDARSGDTWDTYWHTSNSFVYAIRDYSDILARSDEAIKALEYLITLPEPTGGVALPITRKAFYRLVMPHLYQIRQFACMYLDFSAVEQLKASGADKATLQEKINAIDFEIPEYNCIIGLWGQTEARIGYRMIEAFCRENGLVIPERGQTTKNTYKRRILDRIRVAQRGLNAPYLVDVNFYESGWAFSPELNAKLFSELVEEGVLTHREDGLMYLTNWSDYRFDFNI